jgi:hypothetical protein
MGGRAPAAAADAAFTSVPAGVVFAEWFDRHRIDDHDWQQLAESVPISRIYQIIDEARRRARLWDDLAERLRQRVERCGRH